MLNVLVKTVFKLERPHDHICNSIPVFEDENSICNKLVENTHIGFLIIVPRAHLVPKLSILCFLNPYSLLKET